MPESGVPESQSVVPESGVPEPQSVVAVLSAAAGLRAASAEFDPASLAPDGCAAVVGELAAAEKACAGARVRAAARAAAAGAHRGSGFRDAADWLASVSGSSAGEAAAGLATAAALDGCPVTREAVVAGELSLAQAREITAVEAQRAGSEAELVGLARRSSLAALRHEARRRRLAAVDVEVLHARQRAARSVRHWRDDLGMVCGRFALPPEVGVAFVNRLDAATDRIRRRARRTGPLEGRDAHAADAFAAILAAGTDVDRADTTGGTGAGHRADTGAGTGDAGGTSAAGGSRRSRGRSAEVVIVCDLRAWRRGHAHPGEPCHIAGASPLPVPVAKQLAEDAFMKAVVHDGRRIDTVVHWGRHIPAEVRTALELGAPPGFDGAVCVEPGCGRRHGLEWDHVNPVANRGPTSYANLAARCWPHHHDKTDRDRAAGRLGTPAGGTRTGRAPP